MARDLVTIGIHALQDGRIASRLQLDLAFTSVVADNEKRGLDAVLLEGVKQL